MFSKKAKTKFEKLKGRKHIPFLILHALEMINVACKRIIIT